MEAKYYLFGSQAVDAYMEFTGTAEEFRTLIEQTTADYDIFRFVIGKTDPTLLLAAYDGWRDSVEIPELFYETLRKRRIMSWMDVKNLPHDASGSDNPESVLWYRNDNNVYYPLF